MILGIDISRINQEKRTGVEWYAYYLLLEFTKIMPQDVHVRVYTREPLLPDLVSFLPESWEVCVLQWPPKRLWTQIRLSAEMLLRPPDVLFIPAHVFPWIHPKKTVMTVHDIAAAHFPESYNWFEQWYSLWSAKKAVSALWKVITPSEFTKKDIVQAAKTKYASHIVPIHMGVDQQLFSKKESKVEVLKKYQITKPYILSVGRLEYKKNTARIIKTFEEIKKTHDLQLVLIGKPGHGFEEVKEATENSPHKQDIVQPGWVGEGDLPQLYNGASVFFFPSLYEGFGMPLLEAFACQVPVVCSNNGSLPEVAQGAAILVDPTNVNQMAKELKDLLDDPIKQQSLINTAKEQVSKFSWNKTAKETLALLLSE